MSHPRSTSLTAVMAGSGLLFLALGVTSGRGDEPGRLGRLFRFGTSAPAHEFPERAPTEPTSESPALPIAPISPAEASPAPPASSPRLVPQPRVSRAVTDADPLVTRISLGRTDDGTQFGMFLQVYADGTVIDSEGVHHVGRETIKDVSTVLGRGDAFRLKGHCGEPSTDFIEQVQMVVYERSLGRLRANAFSFSGNPHGCDHAVHQLQSALDALQAKLSRVAPEAAPSSVRPSNVPTLTPSAAPIRLNEGDAPTAG